MKWWSKLNLNYDDCQDMPRISIFMILKGNSLILTEKHNVLFIKKSKKTRQGSDKNLKTGKYILCTCK